MFKFPFKRKQSKSSHIAPKVRTPNTCERLILRDMSKERKQKKISAETAEQFSHVSLYCPWGNAQFDDVVSLCGSCKTMLSHGPHEKSFNLSPFLTQYTCFTLDGRGSGWVENEKLRPKTQTPQNHLQIDRNGYIDLGCEV